LKPAQKRLGKETSDAEAERTVTAVIDAIKIGRLGRSDETKGGLILQVLWSFG
jgi:hypothetical protein